MFYSKELLNRRTPLGVAWYAAHNSKSGKLKLNRGAIMQVNIGETCKQVLFPAIPQSLRTVAILANGLVIIHGKQSEYLLHDCEDTLRQFLAISKDPEPTQVDGELATEDAITLKGQVDDILDATSLFPALHPALSLAPASAASGDDMFAMPSIPDTPGRRSLMDAPAGSQGTRQELFMMADPMDIMEAPDLPADFEALMAGMGELPGFETEAFPEPPPPGEEAELDRRVSVTPEPVAEGAARAQAKRRRKKPVIDSLETIFISGDTIRHNLTEAGGKELLVPRPLQLQPPAPDSFMDVGPATGPWPPALMAVWRAAGKVGGWSRAERLEAEGQGEDDQAQAPKRKRRGRGAAGNPMEEKALFGDDMMPPAPMDFPMDDGYGYDLMMGGPGELGAGAEEDPFAGAARRREAAASLGGSDLETERLRAALHGTPGGDYRDAMLQLGLTPASGSDRRLSNGGRRTRSSAGLRRDSDSGRLSDRSSDRGRDPRLADMLAELQGADADLGAALPAVGEDEPFLGGGGRRRRRQVSDEPSGGLTQFHLLEESGPTAPSGPTPTPVDDVQTLHVLALVKPMLEKGGGSLFEVTAGLSRMEAAKIFAHLLVAATKSYVHLEQGAPYGDIEVTFTI